MLHLLAQSQDTSGADSSAPSFLEGPFASLGIALVLGLLVGMQRERTNRRVAGVRTFALITVLGCGSALAASVLASPWVVAAGAAGLAALLIMGNFLGKTPTKPGPGITTEVAALVMYFVGALLGAGERGIPAAIGGGAAVLLQFKAPLHRFIRQLGDRDVRAIMQFALISAVILPVLPDRDMGPYDALNPRRIWMMVVLIVGLSLAAYAAYKFVKARSGDLVAGVLGGLISSTATTISFARRAKSSPAAVNSAVLVIMIATTVAYARVLVLVAIAAPAALSAMALPIGLMLLVSAGVAGALWWRTEHGPTAIPEQGNPSELKSALMFGAIYAVALLATAAAQDWWGNRGLYVVGLLAGLVDLDAITLSTSRMTAGGVAASEAWRAIVLASISNMVFKGGAAWVIGGRGLGLRLGAAFGIVIGAGLLLVLLWPRP